MLAIALPNTATATITVCPTRAYKQYHYGRMASLSFDVGRVGPGSITKEVEEFAARNGLSYSSVELRNPYKHPPLEKLDQILQDTMAIGGQSTRYLVERRHHENPNLVAGMGTQGSERQGSVRVPWPPSGRVRPRPEAYLNGMTSRKLSFNSELGSFRHAL
jgi:hypothetical protein